VGLGVGLVLLSTKSDGEIAALVFRCNHSEPGRGRRVALNDVMENVIAIRKQGYFFSRQLRADGAGVIAMPFPDTSNNRSFVIALGGPVRRLEENLSSNLAAIERAIKTYLRG
jgi:DNA-binding IclR family transcriptional regulator